MALLPTDPQKQKKLLLALLPLVAAFGYYYFIHTGVVAELETTRTRLEDLEAKNATARALAQGGGPELQRRLAMYQANMERLEQLIPRREQVRELLYSITLEAQRNNVELVNMTPRGEEPGSFYVRQTYTLAVRGAYHDIGAFLASLGSLPRIITATGLKVIPEPVRDQEEVPLLAEFIAETYVIPDPGELVPDTTAAAPAGRRPAPARPSR